MSRLPPRATSTRTGYSRRQRASTSPTTYSDYREMLDAEKPDGVYCLMPPHHLYDISINVLQRGHNLFVEKPPGLNAFQTSSMAKTAAKYGALTMTAFNRRFIPLMREVRAQVEARGPIIQFQSVFLKHQFTPAGDLPYYGGATDILSCDAVHAVDVCRWLGGERRGGGSQRRARSVRRLSKRLQCAHAL